MAVSITPQQGLGAFCGLLLAGCLYEMLAPFPAVAIPQWPLRARGTAVRGEEMFLPPPSSAFDAINARMIFAPDRKPVTPAAIGAAAAPPPPPTISLVGIILDTSNRLALIRSAASPLEVTYGVGARIGGWELFEIDPDAIVLRFGTATSTIELASNRHESTGANTSSQSSSAGPTAQGANPSASPQPQPPLAPPQSVSPAPQSAGP